MSEIRKLRMLVELDRRGTISAVAAALSYSTSGVSQQLVQLERDMGVRLLEPDGRRLRLTPAGHALVRVAPEVLDAWDRAGAETAAASSRVAGPVRVALFQTALLSLGAELALRVAECFPEVALSVVQAEPEEATPGVRSRDLDLALIESYPGIPRATPPGLAEAEVSRDAMHLAVAKGVRGRVRIADLKDRPWAMEPVGSDARAWAEAQCRRAGFTPRVVFETSDIVAHCDLVRVGTAVAFIPALTPSAHTSGVRLLPAPPEQMRSLSIVSRSGDARHPAIAAVRGVIEELLG